MKTFFLAFAFMLAMTLAASAQITSVYTSLDTKDCKTIEANAEEAGWYRGRCKGVAGYSIELLEGDIRQTINIIDPRKKEHELELWYKVSGGFSATGMKAEWRMKGKVPIALIVRFNASEDPEKPEKTTSYLVVSKITKSKICVTDVLKPMKNQNEAARELADKAAQKPCYERPED